MFFFFASLSEVKDIYSLELYMIVMRMPLLLLLLRAVKHLALFMSVCQTHKTKREYNKMREAVLPSCALGLSVGQKMKPVSDQEENELVILHLRQLCEAKQRTHIHIGEGPSVRCFLFLDLLLFCLCIYSKYHRRCERSFFSLCSYR